MDRPQITVSFAHGQGDNALEREIVRNVTMILTTSIGTCPLYRDFGTDHSMLDKSLPVAQNLYAVAVIDAVERWEPRVRVLEVTFTPTIGGQLTAAVVLDYAD